MRRRQKQEITSDERPAKINAIFRRLASNDFRSRFRLSAHESAYLRERGLAVLLEHARGFFVERLAPADPANDGRQTPWRGHPAFVAQHATATCCRGCLSKWHGIARGRALTADEVDYMVSVVARWLETSGTKPAASNQPRAAKRKTAPPTHSVERQSRLFDA